MSSRSPWTPDRPSALAVATAAALSAVGLWWGTGLQPIWWLTWLAPWPVLAVGARASVPVAAVAAFSAWAGGALNLWRYEHVVIGMPAPAVLAAAAAPALAFTLGALLLRALARRGRPLSATLVLPAWGTTLEYLASLVSPHGTFGSLAYTQTDFLPVVQLASLLGPSGITFLLLLVPSALATLGLPSARPARARVAVLGATVIVSVLAFGGWRLAESRRSTGAGSHLTIGLVAADRPEQPVATTTADGERLIAAYLETTQGLAAQGAQVVVWPETVLRANAGDLDRLERRVADATGGRAIVVVGVDSLAPGGETNSALVFSGPEVAPVAYVKHHLLLPPEARYRRGSELALVALPPGHAGSPQRAGVAICKDLDFPALARLYAGRGASLLLVPAWDFAVDGRLHSRMAVLRGVEGGFAVARAARGGRLTLSDDRGRVIAESRSGETSVASVLASVPIGVAGTPYSRLGDWFAGMACALTVFLLSQALLRRR